MMRRSLDIFMARPFTHTWPEMVPYLTVPMRAFRKVVLPAPLGPITAATCDSKTCVKYQRSDSELDGAHQSVQKQLPPAPTEVYVFKKVASATWPEMVPNLMLAMRACRKVVLPPSLGHIIAAAGNSKTRYALCGDDFFTSVES